MCFSLRFDVSLLVCFLLFCSQSIYAQIVPVGIGSYTTVFPGTDAAGRNRFPSGTPLTSGIAATKPVPTNDWWSLKVKENHVSNLFNYPYTLKTVNSGLVVSYIPWGVIDDMIPITVGVSGLNASRATVSDFSDWTVTMDWSDGSRNFTATAGIGMPFIYFTKGSADVAAIKVNSGTVTVDNEMLVITNAKNGADFAVYAPRGSTWTNQSGTYVSDLNGQNYWSIAFIPLTATNVTAVANEYKKYAYVFPKNTTVSWDFNESTSILRSDFTIETDVKEGTASNVLMGLLPHQWANLAADSPRPDKYSYETVRGELKTLDGNRFSVANTFFGILPTLPYVDNYSEGFSPAFLYEKVQLIENDGLATWTDSYNEGQVMNRLIQTARIADLMGNHGSRDKMLATIKERLEDWLTAESGEVAFLFYYNSVWSSMIGYPAGHQQDENLNDHHFHWGYFIHAAAFLEQYQPGWAAEWGPMINLLIRDAASPDHEDEMFPFMRNFSPFAGHAWANGFATFPQGNDQESTSESMQFNSSLIHWGEITGNKAIRDLGIFLYTTEQTAIEEYWFDIYNRNFKPGQQYALVSRVWGNSYDNGTFWTSDIAASYGIQLYPIHGGSLYLGHHQAYATRLWNEIKANTGIMSNQVNPNLWHDIMWKYCAFINPQEAIALYDSYPDRSLKFGVSDAQTYHWLHAMNVLGLVDTQITSDHPLAAVFNKNGTRTYVAHNYSPTTKEVTFSDGFTLSVPANSTATNLDVAVEDTISSLFDQAYTNGNVDLTVNIAQGTVSKVEFFKGNTKIGEDNTSPFTHTATALPAGKHNFYAKIYEGNSFNVSNIISVIVGNQLPFSGAPKSLPGTLEAGNYDKFEGGVGQGIAYYDASPFNEGDYRTEEFVDALMVTAEGATVGWINSGEWLEYSIDVTSSGYYSLIFRFASGNTSGGGPFSLYLDDKEIKSNITVSHTNGWDKWSSKTVTDIPLAAGKRVLKLAFDNGELNIGKFTFTRTGPLDYSQPIANAGGNKVVVLPATTTTLDGSGSVDPGSSPLTYEWKQVYGPSGVTFSNDKVVNPQLSGLKEGVYRIRLTVSNGTHNDANEIFVIVSPTANIAPTITLTSPTANFSTTAGRSVTLSAFAADIDGKIEEVSFFQNEQLIATLKTAPYTLNWTPSRGTYEVYATAKDDGGISVKSQTVTVNVAAVMSCTETSKDASQGSFTTGYNVTFETIGNDVEITFEMLDDKAGVVAYLWRQSPFSETAMNHVSGKKFMARVTGLSHGTNISYACKFAFAGGMSVTKYFTYQVGATCEVPLAVTLKEQEILLYPNPAQDVLYLSGLNQPTQVSIYDINGRLIDTKTAQIDQLLIDIQLLKPGVYFILLQNGEGILTRKFLKE